MSTLTEQLEKSLSDLEGTETPTAEQVAEAHRLTLAVARQLTKGGAGDDEEEDEPKTKGKAKPKGKVSPDLKALLGELDGDDDEEDEEEDEEADTDEESEDDDDDDDEDDEEDALPARKPGKRVQKGYTPEEDSMNYDSDFVDEEGVEDMPEADALLDELSKALNADAEANLSKALAERDETIAGLTETVTGLKAQIEEMAPLLKGLSEAMVQSGRMPASAIPAAYQPLEKGGAGEAKAKFSKEEASTITTRALQKGLCSAEDANIAEMCYRPGGDPSHAEAFLQSMSDQLA